MTFLSDMLTVTGACAGILLLVVLFAAPALTDPAERTGRRRLPDAAVGSLPVVVTDRGSATVREAVRIPAQATPPRRVAPMPVLPLQRRAAMPVVPAQRSLSSVSHES